jgi:hypothetical protein
MRDLPLGGFRRPITHPEIPPSYSNKEIPMVIISKLSYPPESAQEIAKRFMEAPEIPEFLSRKGPYVSSNLSDGILISVLYELDNSKLAEGMDFIGNYYAMFFGVPGFKYEITPHFDVLEGLKMLGMG